MVVISLLIAVIVLTVLGGAFYVGWLKWRMMRREAKNYERGLKMVPMLIHLPPSSDDTEVGARDTRDVAEETISKAQVLYDILASTGKKDSKSKFYGQRHISLEIVAVKGRVQFYVSVPVSMVDIAEQAVISAYPTARLEEVSEHNIFSPVGKMSGTMGGELVLKEDYKYPIATFQDTKRDAIQSILNALSGLGPEDGAGIQLLMRPAKDDWGKKGIEYAKDKKDGKKKVGGGGKVLSFLRQILFALNEPPKEDDDKPAKQLTNLEQSEIDAIEDKTRHAAYEVLIRVVASSNTSQKATTIMNNIKATYALFDAPGKNGFEFSEAHDIESFVTAYIMRFFPPEINKNILNSVELATIFHFPDQISTPTSQLARQESKQVDGPRNMSDTGLLLGYNEFRGTKKEVRISDSDRRRHMYIVGQTGTGKSTMLENLALQDMLAGKGFAFVDPHGDAIDSLMAMVPKERTEDVIYFCPADMDYPLGLNIFEFDSPEQKDFLIQEAINMLYKLYDPQRQGIIGPRYEHWFRNAALTLMADPQGSTFIDIPKVFTDNQYAKQKLKHVTDQTVLEFWNKEMAQTSDYHKSEVLGWFVSKFGAFLSNEMMRNIIGQTKSSFDLREIMDEGKILFVNLSKGRTGELNSKLLGMIFVMKFQAAAMSRANIPEAERRDFSLYVDEFQNFSTDSFSTILSEARKYRLNLIVANQYISQLTDDIRDAVFGNVGSIVTYRTGATDADFLVKQFSPVFDVDDLVKVPNFQTVMRLMINNVPSQPFSMSALPPLGHQNPELSTALKRLSAAKHGRPKKQVEEEIFKRLKTIEPPRPAFGAGRPGAAGQQPKLGQRPSTLPPQRPGAVGQQRLGVQQGQPRAGQASQQSAAGQAPAPSFLDDWLQKRRQRTAGKVQASPSQRLTQDVDNLFDKPAPASVTGMDQVAPAGQGQATTTPPAAPRQPQPAVTPSMQQQARVASSNETKSTLPVETPSVGGQAGVSPAPVKETQIPNDQANDFALPDTPVAPKSMADIEQAPTTQSTPVSPSTESAEDTPTSPMSEEASLSQLLKAKLNTGNSGSGDSDAQGPAGPSLELDDDMYIDKEGFIHYKKEDE